MINKHDIIEMNKQFDKGKLINESSLDFAFSNLQNTKDWLKESAYLTRAILIDHVFEEGNKRTAAGIIAGFFEEQGLDYHPEKIAKAIITLLMKNITSITITERVIKNAVV